MVYRARYIPTGEFYKATGEKSNLSKVGKIYTNKPQWGWLKFINLNSKRTETQPSDWELVSYDLTEVGTEEVKVD